MEHIVSKETYETMKDYGKQLVVIRREDKAAERDYQRALMKHHQEWCRWDSDSREWVSIYLTPKARIDGKINPEYVEYEAKYKAWNDWKDRPVHTYRVSKEEARAFNLLYGFIRGRSYQDIEGNARIPEGYWPQKTCIKVGVERWEKEFKLPHDEITAFLKGTPFAR